MLHAASAQAPSHIAEIEALHAKKGKSIMGKAEGLCFGVLVRPHLGKIEILGGAYGKY
jgi:hypothetical protein